GPNDGEGYHVQANILVFAGRPEEAIQRMAVAMRLNPHYQPFYAFDLGWAYLYAGRYAESIAAMKECLSRNPNHLPSYLNLAGNSLLQWGFQLSPDPPLLEHAETAVRQALAI